jgi:hypothetical protein
MMLENSRAISARSLLDDTMRAGSWLVADMDGEIEAPADLSTATGPGRVADLIGLTVNGSGMQRFYTIRYKTVNERAIALLQRWIDQYGDDRDPDLDQQIRELNYNRVSFHERC